MGVDMFFGISLTWGVFFLIFLGLAGMDKSNPVLFVVLIFSIIPILLLIKLLSLIKNKRWILFWVVLLSSLFLEVNLFLGMVLNAGIFHSSNPDNLTYVYKVSNNITQYQVNNLKQYLSSYNQTVNPTYTAEDILYFSNNEKPKNPEYYGIIYSNEQSAFLPMFAILIVFGGTGLTLLCTSLGWWAVEYNTSTANNISLTPNPNSTYYNLSPSAPIIFLDKIDIPSSTQGLIALRSWDTDKSYCLHSLGLGNHSWESSFITANKVPSQSNTNGIYAHRLGQCNVGQYGHHIGIVELSGKIICHKDGVIRAEHCQVLTIITSSKSWGQSIGSKYQIPIVYSDNVSHCVYSWFFSDDCLYWLQHNKNLLDSLTGKKYSLQTEVDKILESKNF